MPDLILLNESSVTEDQIDSLGHMNVRYYMSRMAGANTSLMADSGIVPAEVLVRRVDTYTRFLAEQFSGARLQTFGALVKNQNASEPGIVSAYFEIRNPDKSQVAAAFLVACCGVNTTSRQTVPLNAGAAEFLTDIPDHGKPRSLNLDPPQQVALQDIEANMPLEPIPGMMSGRREAEVHPDDCDDSGRLHEETDLMFVLHRPGSNPTDTAQFGPPALRDASGRRFSFAMIETRSCIWHRPHRGDVVVSLGADINFGEKWRHSRRWMFVRDSGLLLGVSDTVGICLDLDARKAIPIPADIRIAMEQNALSQFA